MKILAISFILTVLLASHQCWAQDLFAVRAAIAEQEAEWQAAENRISELPDDDIRRMMGTILGDPMPGVPAPGLPSDSVPAVWDWRNAAGSCYVTPVKDQASCGSCWAFGSVAQLESAQMIVSDQPGIPLDLSEQYMVSCDKANLGCNGGYMNRAYDFLRSEGVPLESCFPYTAADLPCSQACSDPVLVSILQWESIKQQIADMQEAAYAQPVTCAFYVYRDFLYYESGVYKHVTGDLLGGHAVCIVGWNVEDASFIVKNSWGDHWGEGGYFRIAFAEVAGPCRFGRDTGRFYLEEPNATGENTLCLYWGAVKR